MYEQAHATDHAEFFKVAESSGCEAPVVRGCSVACLGWPVDVGDAGQVEDRRRVGGTDAVWVAGTGAGGVDTSGVGVAAAV